MKKSFSGRLADGLRYAFTGTPAKDWFGPLDPMVPQAPPEVDGRNWDYPTGINLISTPRADDVGISFGQLRALADNYDLLRLVIETRKDQIAGLTWEIQPRDKSKSADDPRIKQIMTFLEMPDGFHGWDQWVRLLVEDMLVIDAATILPRYALGGQIGMLDVIDGATIKRVIDDKGRTPTPPLPAYQQILKGLVAHEFTADEIFYLPRNPRANRIYGLSPVEQIVMTINIGIRRQIHQLNYYTEGNVPEALIGVPATWTNKQIKEFQELWDAMMEGNLAQRRHGKFVPGDIAKNYVETKAGALKDEYDEWLARIVCYAFSVSPQWAVKQMNRSTAETANESAQAEGLAPLQAWLKGVINRLLARIWNAPDLELVWRTTKDVDPAVEANISKTYLSMGVLSVNEVRASIGLDPIPLGEKYRIYTATGAVPLDQVDKPPAPPPMLGHNGAPAMDPDVTPPGTPRPREGAPAPKKDDQAESDDKEGDLAKSAEVPREHGSPQHIAAMEQIWRRFLIGAAAPIAHSLAHRFGRLAKSAADDDDDADDQAQPAAPSDLPEEAAAALVTGRQSTPEQVDKVIQAIEAALQRLTWDHLESESAAVIQAQATDGVAAGVAVLGNLPAVAGMRPPVNPRQATAPETPSVPGGIEQAEISHASVGVGSGGEGAVPPAQAAEAAGAANSVATPGAVLDRPPMAMDMLNLANPRAVAWAAAHAAELVADIDDATRNYLRDVIVQGLEQGWSVARLQDAIMQSQAFSPARAYLIARHEMATADIMGNLIGWQAAEERFGFGLKKRIILGASENHCAACLAAVRDGAIPIGEDFSTGQAAPPFHPRCGCDIVPVTSPADSKKPLAKIFDPSEPRDASGEWTVEGEIRKGVAAIDDALAHKKDVPNAFRHPVHGHVTLIYGKEGNPAKLFKGGSGLSHIVAKRTAEGENGVEVARKLPEIILRGTQEAPYGPPGAQRMNFRHEGHTAVLSQMSGGQAGHWILTGWKDRP